MLSQLFELPHNLIPHSGGGRPCLKILECFQGYSAARIANCKTNQNIALNKA